MTLITYVVTPGYVVLASDRRQTTFVNNKPVKFEDVAVKTFFLRGQLLMGYTGVAVLDGKPMETWVSELLSGVTPNEIPQTLAAAMQDYYGRHSEVRGMPHHFRMAGFAYDPGHEPSTWPIGYEVGNCRWEERNGRVRAVDVTDQFQWKGNHFGNRRQAVGAVGAPYSLQSLRALEGTVRHALRANPMDPSLLFDPLVSFMRGVAHRSNGTVGETILVTSVPRSAVPVHDLGWTFPITAEGFVAARSRPFAMMLASGSSDPTAYLPVIINPEIQISNITITTEPPGD